MLGRIFGNWRAWLLFAVVVMAAELIRLERLVMQMSAQQSNNHGRAVEQGQVSQIVPYTFTSNSNNSTRRSEYEKVSQVLDINMNKRTEDITIDKGDKQANTTTFPAPRRLDHKIIYFQHIKKSGGTSMCELARKNGQRVGEPNCLPQVTISDDGHLKGHWGCCGKYSTKAELQHFYETTQYDFLGPEDAMQLEIDTDRYRYVTTLRDPKSRYLSHWKYDIRTHRDKFKDRPNVSFDEWFLDRIQDNYSFRQICGCKTQKKFHITREQWNTTIDRLLQFDSIIFLEDFDASLQKFANKVQWKVGDETIHANPAPFAPEQNITMDPLITALDDAMYEIAYRLHHDHRPYTAISSERNQSLEAYFEQGPKRKCRSAICCPNSTCLCNLSCPKKETNSATATALSS